MPLSAREGIPFLLSHGYRDSGGVGLEPITNRVHDGATVIGGQVGVSDDCIRDLVLSGVGAGCVSKGEQLALVPLCNRFEVLEEKASLSWADTCQMEEEQEEQFGRQGEGVPFKQCLIVQLLNAM